MEMANTIKRITQCSTTRTLCTFGGVTHLLLKSTDFDTKHTCGLFSNGIYKKVTCRSHLNYIDYFHEQKRLGIQFNKSDTRDCIGSHRESYREDAEPEGWKF